jgi:FlaA1/EpsC-like NDP-sugar epimerase
MTGIADRRQRRTLIAGAGEAGQMTLNELRAHPRLGLVPLGFIDDAPAKQGRDVDGLPVLGPRQALGELVREHEIDLVVIAMPSAPGEVVRDIVTRCKQAGVEVRTVPGLAEIISGQVQISQVRGVQVEDLLRRRPVRTDNRRVQAMIEGRRVLLTGAGGSIGSEIAVQIAPWQPEHLVLLGHGENSIFRIANRLREQVDVSLSTVICSIANAERLAQAFDEARPDVVFHAAAHKHVPLMEENPFEAVVNNVLGTHELVRAALAHGVERFTFISSDKAVNPTTIMGATKYLGERIVRRAAIESGRAYVSVRFGNVLGSRGSVVEIFQRQVEKGGPVTVTDPRMERFFMSIPEAVSLVLQASTLGRGGEVFVLDMGAPIRIVDLARDMITLSGLVPDRDVAIVYTGQRSGEKLTEDLFFPDEEMRPTEVEGVTVAGSVPRPVDDHLDELIDDLRATVRERDVPRLARLLTENIPFSEFSFDSRSQA